MKLKIRPIGSILLRISKIILKLVICLLAFGYVWERYEAQGIKQETVVRRCSGARNPEAVCDCYNYYGRKCLSAEMLGWGWSPSEETEDYKDEVEYEEGEQGDA